ICHERIKKRGKILFHTNKAILRSMLLKNKQLYYLMKLRREYLRLFNNNSVIRNTNIIFINDNSGRINEYVDDYILAKKSI
ncbi:MAG TPA: thymidylate kinase, partial [Clostridia bacterium]|nr:thymidylate kinase [Clostridia bacterium]